MNGEQCACVLFTGRVTMRGTPAHVSSMQMDVTHVLVFSRSQSICKTDLRPVDSADKSVKSI